MRTRSLILLAGVVGMTLGWAQDQVTAAPDAPGRAARLGLVVDNVSFQPGSVDDWVPATVNRPLTTGDRLWTDTGARAEINLGSSVFRLNSHTNFSFISLDDRIAQVQLSTGSVNLRVRRLADDESVLEDRGRGPGLDRRRTGRCC